MAGSFPDVPGYRFAYDVDGTTVGVYYTSAHPSVPIASSALRVLNNNLTNTAVAISTSSNGYVYFVFPELRNISGILVNLYASTQFTGLQYSGDSTNGMDGTWQTDNNIASISTTDFIRLVTDINLTNLTNVKAIRYPVSRGSAGGGNNNNVHIYGSIAPTESVNRLRIVDLTSDSTFGDGITASGLDISTQLDFGNLNQRASSTREFKVINNSTHQSANSITISLDAPSDASPSIIGQYQISTDNVGFANSINIGTLAPGAESGILYIRMNPANNAQLGPWPARIIAHPTSWSGA